MARFTRRFGDWKIVYNRYNQWSKTGVWEEVFKQLANDSDNEYEMIDSAIVRAHQHSAGAKKIVDSKRLASFLGDPI